MKISKLKAFFSNTFWILFDRVFHMILSLIVTGITARYLGKDNYGMINYGLAYINIFTIVCKFGIDSIIVNEIIQNKDKSGDIIGTTIGLRFISGVLSVGMISGLVGLLNPGNTEILLITFIQSISLLFVSLDTIDFFFQSKLQSKYTAIAKLVSYLLVCGWRLVLVLIGADTFLFAVASILDALVTGLFLYIFFNKKENIHLKFSIKVSKELINKSYQFIISSILVTIYTQMDKIMLGAMTDDTMVGLYSAAATLANMWVLIPVAVIDSSRPLIMVEKRNKNEISYLEKYGALYSFVIWIGIFAGVMITLFGRLPIRLIYGREFLDAVPILVIIVWSKLFSTIGITRGIWIVSENKGKYQKYFVGVGAVLNLILNSLMIPKFGAMGAAVATLITEAVSTVIVVVFFKETRVLIKIMFDAFLCKNIKKKYNRLK